VVSHIIEFCAKNRFLVILGVAFATVAAIYSIRQTKLDAIPGVGPRQVERAMWTAPKGLAWYRIVTASGAPADHSGAAEQRRLLKAEGVTFKKNGAVDWSQCRWKGPSQKWIEKSGQDIETVMEVIAGWAR